MSDSEDKGLYSYYGGAEVGGSGGYNFNSAGGYGYPFAGNSGYVAQSGGYLPVAYPYPTPSGYPPSQAACPGHHHHSGHRGLGELLGAVAGYMMSHGHGHAHGGYTAHGGGYGYGRYHHSKFKHGKFGKHGKYKHKHGWYRKWM